MAAQADITLGYNSSGLFRIKLGEEDKIAGAIAAVYAVIDVTDAFVDIEMTRLLQPIIRAGEFWITVVYRSDTASATARGELFERLADAGITVLGYPL